MEKFSLLFMGKGDRPIDIIVMEVNTFLETERNDHSREMDPSGLKST